MTDTDWLTAYSNLNYFAVGQFQGSPGSSVPVPVSVSFTAHESFTDFPIMLPFSVPGSNAVPAQPSQCWTPSDGSLLISKFQIDGGPPADQFGCSNGIIVSGQNVTDAELAATFYLAFSWMVNYGPAYGG